MKSPKIKDIKVIFTEPDNIRLIIVKILTDQDGLYGVGCATKALSTSAVPRLCPDTIITSSTRPVIQ